VHQPHEVARLFRVLFYPRVDAAEVVHSIDAKIASLPGLSGMSLMQDYFERAGLI
jgi:hypothetical protein